MLSACDAASYQYTAALPRELALLRAADAAIVTFFLHVFSLKPYLG